MRVKLKGELGLPFLVLVILTSSIVAVSGEARRGGGRRARVFGEGGTKTNVTDDDLATGFKRAKQRQGRCQFA